MLIYIGADHGGFALKEKMKQLMKAQGYDLVDLGASVQTIDDDYPDFARLVAERVSASPVESRGILICRSGFGMDIVANKFRDVRAGLPMSPDHAFQARHDDNINIVCLAADFVDEPTAMNIVKVFLSTEFGKEAKYQRRLEKISNVEFENRK